MQSRYCLELRIKYSLVYIAFATIFVDIVFPCLYSVHNSVILNYSLYCIIQYYELCFCI